MPRRLATLATTMLAALALAACGGGSSGMTGPAAIVESTAGATSGPFEGMAPPQVLDVGALSLPDVAHGGAPLAFKPAPGHLLLVFFGFTNCTDVCPTTMANLRAAIRRLPAADRGRVRVAFITVDPQRDTPAKVAAYVRKFLPDGSALRTDDDAALRRVATAFSTAYAVKKLADGTVDVEHTAFVYAVGAEGRVLVMWPDGTSTDAVEHDLRALLADAA